MLFAAARYCCTTGNALPLQELTTAGADWVQPNRHGVSPLLLLKRHTAKGRHLPRAVEEGLLDGCWKQKWTRQVRRGGRHLGLEGLVEAAIAAVVHHCIWVHWLHCMLALTTRNQLAAFPRLNPLARSLAC